MTVPLKRSCGKCTACCKTHLIVEIDKRIGKWCPHCNIGVGCKIYGDHPESCREFKCEWLKGFGKDSERPDRVKVVLCYFKIAMDGKFKDFAINEASRGSSFGQVVREILEISKIAEEGDGIRFLQIWEAIEGAINSSFVKKLTIRVLLSKISVQQILLSGEVIKIPDIQHMSTAKKERIYENEVHKVIANFDKFFEE